MLRLYNWLSISTSNECYKIYYYNKYTHARIHRIRAPNTTPNSCFASDCEMSRTPRLHVITIANNIVNHLVLKVNAHHLPPLSSRCFRTYGNWNRWKYVASNIDKRDRSNIEWCVCRDADDNNNTTVGWHLYAWPSENSNYVTICTVIFALAITAQKRRPHALSFVHVWDKCLCDLTPNDKLCGASENEIK